MSKMDVLGIQYGAAGSFGSRNWPPQAGVDLLDLHCNLPIPLAHRLLCVQLHPARYVPPAALSRGAEPSIPSLNSSPEAGPDPNASKICAGFEMFSATSLSADFIIDKREAPSDALLEILHSMD